MTSRRTAWLCAGTLLLGIAAGASVDIRSLAPRRANALDAVTAERVYQELGSAPSSLQESSELLARIAAVTAPSVVHIQSEYKSASRGRVEETGSGVIVSSPRTPGTFVVTNRHVIAAAGLNDIAIHLYDGTELRPQRVWSDSASDLAVMKVEGANLVPARWGDSDQLKIGHMVLAMGSPFGLSRSVTYGIISAKGRRSLKLPSDADVLNQDFLQTDAAINPGNSGGPLIDLHGRVIGINTAIASSSGGNEGIGFSIPSNLVVRIIDQLLQYDRVQRAYLGVKLDPFFGLKDSKRLQLDRVQGSRVTEVYSNTPASRANLQFDDIILSFDGIPVQDENHLINLVSLADVGRRVRLSVWRAGRAVTLYVDLAERPDGQTSEVPTEPGMGIPIQQMGLTLHPLDADLAAQLGYAAGTRGLLVLKIDGSSPLSGDLRIYDLIEEVARTPVRTVGDLSQALTQTRGNDSVLVRIRRNVPGDTEGRLVVWRK